MIDEHPWTDDRARQSSLLEDDDALRTAGRSGETVTGSESFVDDRDGDVGDHGEQAGLFTEREELEGQGTLGGGTATRTTEGVLEPEIDAYRGSADLTVDERQGVPEATAATLDEIATDAEAGSGAFEEDTGALDPTPDDGSSLELEAEALDEFSDSSTPVETVEIEFGSRDAANAARETVPEGTRTGTYDGRHTTVEVREDQLSEQQLTRLSGMAADSKAYKAEKVGQAPLSRRERQEIDFTETSVPEARSAKAIFADRGVDDWLSFFDPTLTVDEQRDIAERAARDDRGKRMDTDESAVEKEARARRRTAGELERFARQGAEAGEEEAVRTLVDELGWNESEARALAQSTDDPQTRGDVLDTVVARALANGQFLREPPARTPGAPSKYRSQTTGRFVGNRIDSNPGIGRDPADGRFLNERSY